jgi:acyl-coenzyme A synthetase/AMP-(fatty) acid ligase
VLQLYTSGSTGKPKGVVHTTAGYLLGAGMTLKYVFDVHEDDKFACMADGECKTHPSSQLFVLKVLSLPCFQSAGSLVCWSSTRDVRIELMFLLKGHTYIIYGPLMSECFL